MTDQLPQVLEGDALDRRVAQAAHDARGAYASSTVATYGYGVRRFVQWCDDTGRTYGLPVDPRDLAGFIDDMSAQLAPATVKLYTSAIGRMHDDLDLPSPSRASVVRLALRRMMRSAASSRVRGHKMPGRGQARPMHRDTLDAALEKLGDSLADLRDGALIALAYDSMCRASELVALRVSDITPEAREGFAAVYVAKSKTDQEGEGDFAYVSRDTLGRLRAWIEAARLDPEAFLFFSLSPVGGEPAPHLSPRDVARIYKRRVGEDFSAHSTRVGSALDQRAEGIETGLIARGGRWKTTAMVDSYARHLDAGKSGPALLARMQGRA